MKSFKLNDIDLFSVERALTKDLPEIRTLLEGSSSTLKWLGYDTPSIEADNFVTNKDLPPGGQADRSFRLVIRCKKDGQALGILNYYCGYPTNESVYIGDIFIHSEFKRTGIGKTIVSALESQAVTHGATKVFANLGLKNWPALRFWINRGYKHIVKITGDSEFSNDTFASIEVGKQLQQDKSLGT